MTTKPTIFYSDHHFNKWLIAVFTHRLIDYIIKQGSNAISNSQEFKPTSQRKLTAPIFLSGLLAYIDTLGSRRGLIYEKIHQKFNLSKSATGTHLK
jgi:hypothetical protein